MTSTGYAVEHPVSRDGLPGGAKQWLVLGLALAVAAVGVAAAATDPAVAAAAEQTRPLKAGARAPAFEVRTVDGESFVFDPDNLARPVVIITFRGGWCPYCNLHLSELRNAVPQIRDLGIDVLFLSGDRPELLYTSLQRETQQTIDGIDYRILSDADAVAAKAFGIAFRVSVETLQRRREKGDDIDGSSMLTQDVLAVPSVFAINREGMIEAAYSNPDYRVRLSAEEILQAARGMIED